MNRILIRKQLRLLQKMFVKDHSQRIFLSLRGVPRTFGTTRQSFLSFLSAEEIASNDAVGRLLAMT